MCLKAARDGLSFLTAVLLLAMPWSAMANATTLHYDAFLAGVKIGTATVTVERTQNTYRINGEAAANGVAYLFSDWRSEFYAGGSFVSGAPQLESYGYDERERRKHRILEISNGEVRQRKNGKPRPVRPLLGGLDVLTAFFIAPDCWQEQLLHTGRYNYWIRGRPSSRAGWCRFEVTDDDGDRDRVQVEFEDYQGVRLPVRMTTEGLLRGSVRLRKPKPVPAT